MEAKEVKGIEAAPEAYVMPLPDAPCAAWEVVVITPPPLPPPPTLCTCALLVVYKGANDTPCEAEPDTVAPLFPDEAHVWWNT
jgi:hypothetical protein